MADSIKEVLMRRDGMTEVEADDLVSMARADLIDRLETGECAGDICQEWFGLEPDYLDDLIPS